MTLPDGLTRRRLLGAAGTAALGSTAGCQTDDSDGVTTVTPAPVPEGDSGGGTLTVQHAAAGQSGPTAAAMSGLLARFAGERPGVDLVETPSIAPPAAERSVVRFGRLGAALLLDSGIGSFVPLEEQWAPSFPGALLSAAFADWETVAVPIAVDPVNCLYYNPAVVADAGLELSEYATIRDLAARRDRFASIETLLAQPMRTPLDRLALWESLLSGRLAAQRQYQQLLAGRAFRNRPLLKSVTADFGRALSMLPGDPADPTALLDRVVDGEIGFVRLPGRVAGHLRERPDAEYGHDWSIAPMFGASGTATVTVYGFAIPAWTAETTLPRAFVRFGTRIGPMREYCRTREVIPARTDAAALVTEPDRRALGARYADASIHALSLSYGVGVRRSVRDRLADALVAFERHGDPERATDDLVAAFDSDPLL